MLHLLHERLILRGPPCERDNRCIYGPPESSLGSLGSIVDIVSIRLTDQEYVDVARRRPALAVVPGRP